MGASCTQPVNTKSAPNLPQQETQDLIIFSPPKPIYKSHLQSMKQLDESQEDQDCSWILPESNYKTETYLIVKVEHTKHSRSLQHLDTDKQDIKKGILKSMRELDNNNVLKKRKKVSFDKTAFKSKFGRNQFL